MTVYTTFIYSLTCLVILYISFLIIQKAAPGAKMPLFSEVIDLIRCYGPAVCNLKVNTEIKYNADEPNTTASRYY